MHCRPLHTCLTSASRRFRHQNDFSLLHIAHRYIRGRAFSASSSLCADENSKDREPVESVLKRILEPEHARYIGVSPSQGQQPRAESREEPASSGSMALVPLNVIYLPPPDWHQPLKPAGLGRKTAALPRKSQCMGGDGAGTRAACGSAVGVEEQRDKDRRRVDGGGESAVASLFRWIGRLAESAKPATAARQRIHRADSQLIKGTVIEKAMESGRQTISQIKALPKTDDWVTWLGKALNQMTGYTRISELKEKVEESGSEFKVARQSLDALKQQYADTVQQRINNQREINSLLQRKHLWNENDVARFTGLYKDEYQAETVEQDASRRLKEAENAVDLKYDMLVNSIRERYHEEQIWSDKIRRASTYGTWAVLFMNILALFLAQAIFEPRKRRKIIDGVDEKLSRAMLAQQEKLDSVAHSLAAGQQGQERSIGAVAQHLSNVAAVLETVVARQDAQLDVLSGPALGPSTGIGSSIDLGGGYSDSELDVYYAQQRSQDTADKHGFAPAVPGSMIWKAVKPAEKSTGASEQQGDAKTKDDRTFTRAEASQLAIETAAVVGCLAAMVTLYFSS